jgi:geranyl-CoA carboxylase alpha subunit
VAALRETVLLGVPTNRVFLAAVLEHPRFVAGEVTTGFVAETAGDGVNDAPIAAPLALAAALLHEGSTPYRGPREWFNWRSTGPAPIAKSIECRGDVLSLALEALGPHAYRVEVDGRSIAVSLDGAEGTLRDVAVDDMRQRIAAVFVDDALHLALPHADLAVRDTTHARARRVVAGSDGSVLSPITGRVIAVPFGPGADVVRGDVVCVIEAMKMEHRITAPLDGYVAELRVAAGAQAAAGSYLMRIEPRSETSQREQRPLGPTDAR